MNKPLWHKKQQKKIRDWPTDKPREEPDYPGRNSSGRRPQNGAPLAEQEEDNQQQGEHFHWFPMSLVALVLLCLVMAAWVWFEILWM